MTARIYPEKMDANLETVLSIMLWNTGSMARLLRDAGVPGFVDVAHKATAEQAAVLHWLIGLVLEHGDGWSDAADLVMSKAAEVVQGKQGGSR